MSGCVQMCPEGIQWYCTIKQCNTSTGLLLLHCTYKHNSWHILMNLVTYLSVEDDDKSIELVHTVYFVSPIDAH